MMELEKFIGLLDKARKRYHMIGGAKAGIVAALDHEGRLFAVVDGMVLNRVNAAAIDGISTRSQYLNPGGDVLWPAPEGTCSGYEYPTGKWRVPPGLTGARYVVVSQTAASAVIETEVDLINSRGLGIPCVFKREVSVESGARLTLKTVETITYIGSRTLKRSEFLIAPWSLSQFDSEPGAGVVFKRIDGAVRDLYDPSGAQRSFADGLCHTKTDSSQRYQIALNAAVDWIEFRNPSKRLTVRRTAAKLASGFDYIDIADAPPEAMPDGEGVRFSVYSDLNGFMEIEAVGGCPATMESGASSSVEVTTEFCCG